MASNEIVFKEINGHFEDRFSKVKVFQVSGGALNFAAFVYQCRLNMDIDGAPTTYGWDNPAEKNSLGEPNLQKNLHPLENWHKKGVSASMAEKVGLGNACGDPGDGTKGWQNFLNGSHNFYWAGVYAVTKQFATANKLIIDDRPELEALRPGNAKPMVAAGHGFFPVVQPKGAPAPGYYVSSTSTVTDKSLKAWDANRYVDGSKVPYAVWANEWAKWKIGGKTLNLGDYGVAIRNSTGANTGYIYGDGGTAHKVGESSQKLNQVLAPDGSSPLVTFIAFPGSGSGREVGKSPETKIGPMVLLQTLKLLLTSNGSELPARVASGPSMQLPKKMSDEQTRSYRNVLEALRPWGVSA